MSKKTNKEILEVAVKLTHSSVAIEGNTLSLKDTWDLLVDGKVSLENQKKMREIYETKNFYQALMFIFNNRDLTINNHLILDLHSIIMENIIENNGKFKTNDNYINGENFLTCPSKLVDSELSKINLDYQNEISNARDDLTKYYIILKYHVKFETIHPFSDGNGRTGRLLMTLMMIQNNLDILYVDYSTKHSYFDLLNKVRENENEVEKLFQLLKKV
ncbi:Fic family protein [Ureaplasma canigenitalium]|uniref:Fic family protein n=1 Tax=Ureaplasma canigenitalium TaxID=42092 RepID=UPI00068958D4|nr:Fic family protein [Ureaplasma canigenitalium]